MVFENINYLLFRYIVKIISLFFSGQFSYIPDRTFGIIEIISKWASLYHQAMKVFFSHSKVCLPTHLSLLMIRN